MSHKRKILVQLDPDPQPSVFDSVVAVDAGVEQLFRHSHVTPENVRALVHGAIFTRGMDDLKSTALFLGGSDVALAERIREAVLAAFFGPMRVSLLFDPNGANTTASAAVLAAGKHVAWPETTVTVLAATGPVGQRVVRVLARAGAQVRVASRTRERAQQVCDAVAARVPQARLQAMPTSTSKETAQAMMGAEVVFAAGAAGVTLLSEEVRSACSSLRVAVDLNAVPPAGIEGVEVMDRGQARHGLVCYGAIGVGGTKMKIHKEAIRRLFDSNTQVLDAEEIYAIGQDLQS